MYVPLRPLGRRFEHPTDLVGVAKQERAPELLRGRRRRPALGRHPGRRLSVERLVEQIDRTQIAAEAGDEGDRAAIASLEHHTTTVRLGDRLQQPEPTAHVCAAPQHDFADPQVVVCLGPQASWVDAMGGDEFRRLA